MRQIQKFFFLCIFIIGLLAACQSQPSLLESDAPQARTAPPDEPTLEAVQAVASDLSGELIVNEDVQRSQLFKLNTLAYELPDMEEVEVVNITYAQHEDQPLTLDVYYPIGTAAGDRRPVVIFGMGYRMSKESLRDAHFYTSWGRLVAAAGMVGITYDTEQPDEDLETLITFIQEHAQALRVDPQQIGLYSSSANTATVMSYLMQEERSDIQFSVYYYGFSLTPDRKFAPGFGESCALRGCLLNELANVTYVDPQMPLFIVKVGRDFVPQINEAMDHFVAYVQGEGAPVTVIEYEEGQHGFDTEDKTEESAAIIAKTIDFMKTNFDMGPLNEPVFEDN